jgi:hypothetical protein
MEASVFPGGPTGDPQLRNEVLRPLPAVRILVMTYLLPCTSCQQSIPVEAVQAGDVVRCECGAKVAVPTLREIRCLPVPEDGQSAGSQSDGAAVVAGWGKLQRYLFAIGFLCAAVSAGLAVSAYLSAARIEYQEIAKLDQLAGEKMIDALTPVGAYEAWKMLQARGIGEQQKPEYVINQERKEEQMARFRFFLYSLVLGILVMGIGVFVVRPRSRSLS